MKIFTNIINNPQISKYGNLNYQKIKNKLSECKPALQLLFISGFVIKDERLIWTNNDEAMNKMQNMNTLLTMNQDQINTFKDLMNEGFSMEEATNAINLSNND